MALTKITPTPARVQWDRRLKRALDRPGRRGVSAN